MKHPVIEKNDENGSHYLDRVVQNSVYIPNNEQNIDCDLPLPKRMAITYCVKKFTDFHKRNLDEFLNCPKDLDNALCDFFQSLIDKKQTFPTNTIQHFKWALKYQVLKLSQRSLDIKNHWQFPNFYVS